MINDVEIFNNRSQETRLIEDFIVQGNIADCSPLNILEAGCGRRWPLDLNDIQYKLTGVDLDRDALNFRKSKFNDLDETVIGDLRNIEFDDDTYDVIYNSFVLEHIDNAEHVMEKFYKWLKPGGILILKIPDRNSVYGFVTRLTPHWVHVYYKKYIRGFSNAGKPGFGPYPTFHNPIVSRSGIHNFCANHNFEIKAEYGLNFYINGKGFVPILTKLFVVSLSLLSLGNLVWKYNNLTYILEKGE